MKAAREVLSSRMRYFVAVATAGSIRAAARELNVASSAINRQILLLEDAVGLALFERGGRGLTLTESGHLLLAEARSSARGFEDALARIEALKGLSAGTLRLASVESVSVEILPELLAGFSTLYPGIAISLEVAGSEAVADRVLARDADIGFTFNPTSLDGLTVAYERAMQIGAIMNPKHPLSTRRKLRLQECLEHPHAWPARGLSLRAALDSGVQADRTGPAPLIECNSLRMMAAMAREGRCLAFQTPIGIAQHLAAGTLVFVPLSDKAIPADRLMVVQQSGRQPGPAARTFLKFASGMLDQTSEKFVR